ncbi:MAG TPA: C25 family cysteine peptidase [bacterium]|nr:C25 family cysteine peptidase [bacterium]
MTSKTTIAFLLLVTGFLTGVAVAANGHYSVDFSMSGLKAETRYLDETSYQTQPFQLFTMDGLAIDRELGEPCLPVKVVQVYVPRGKEIKRVVIESQASSVLPGQYLLLPGQREIPTSSVVRPEQVPPDEAVYASSEPYPSAPVQLTATGTMSGRRIASFKVFPLQYVPAKKELTFNSEIVFSVELQDAPEAAIPLETADVASLRNSIVASMVENGSEVEADFPSTGTLTGPQAVEYLIICHENHVDEYAPLRDWKTRKGVPAGIKTWQEITASYTGRDGAEQFRNCIKDYYLHHSTMWVVIGGSGGKAAGYLRGCYCDVEGTLDEHIPCDLYFSDMDGDWNSDNDSYWGEVGDGTDLYPDVYVGRFTGNTGAQCAVIANKVLTYEGYYGLPTDYEKRILFMAEMLDAQTDGAINKNMIDNESVPTLFDPIQKLYESSGNENHTSAMNALNLGQGIVNHDGHGNPSVISIGPDVLTSDDMAGLTNGPRYTVLYTLACDPAAFDNPMGCLGRSYMEAANGGGFFVGNARYGWYSPGASGYGTGDQYDREFFKSIFKRGYVNLGVIHAIAKVQRIPYSGGDDTDRWAQFSLNLLGDPETPVWLNTPLAMTASYLAEIEAESQTFQVAVSSGGSPVGQARVCLWKGNDIYLVANTTSGGTVTFDIAPADTGTMLVTAAKNGYLPYLGSSHVIRAASGVVDGGSRNLELAVAPNPGMGSVGVSFALPQNLSGVDGKPTIAVYDAAGRFVTNLAVGATARGKVTWDGKSSSGAEVPPGIYFVKMSAGVKSVSAKVVLLK